MIDLSKVGNFQDYKHEPRVVRPLGLIVTPSIDLVLKFYHMTKKERDYSIQANTTISEASRFILNEVREGRLEPLSGLGFAILSEDMLNIDRWDDDDVLPYVLKGDLYGFSQPGFSKPKKLDIRKFGAFCGWELGIVAHETKAWMKYLASERTEADKQKYLEDKISRKLWRR
jgi:hypothetical protein